MKTLGIITYKEGGCYNLEGLGSWLVLGSFMFVCTRNKPRISWMAMLDTVQRRCWHTDKHLKKGRLVQLDQSHSEMASDFLGKKLTYKH